MADQIRSDHFQCLGRLNRDELKSVYQFLALFIIPYEQESLTIDGIEALAYGVPIISIKCGGP